MVFCRLWCSLGSLTLSRAARGMILVEGLGASGGGGGNGARLEVVARTSCGDETGNADMLKTS